VRLRAYQDSKRVDETVLPRARCLLKACQGMLASIGDSRECDKGSSVDRAALLQRQLNCSLLLLAMGISEKAQVEAFEKTSPKEQLSGTDACVPLRIFFF
jgi:hypothetical protein